MKLIVAHQNPDFDALAATALAGLVHPGARGVLLGGLDDSVATLVALYRDALALVEPDEVSPDEVSELIVVDTSDPERIAPYDALLGRVPVTLYDHHPRPERAIPAAHGLHREVGATATLLTLLLKTRAIEIPPALASLALLGIHDDTGSLSYRLTRPEDYEAAAHLLRAGASLELLQQFIRERYSQAHRALLEQLLSRAEERTVAGRRVVTAPLESAEYVSGLAPLCTQLLALYSAEAAFVIARMDAKTLVIGRSAGAFDVGAALGAALGGGGHPGAGFARSELSPAEAEAALLEALPRHASRLVRARDIMSAPVKTVDENTSVDEARRLLTRYGHNGLPVLSGGDLAGMISRRNLDKAVRHDMGGAPVKAFMVKSVVTAREDTPLAELEALIREERVGRVPVRGEDGALVGIVTRSDLIAARHEDASPAQSEAETLLGRLPHAAQDALETAREVAGAGRLYLVGGTVRDAALGVSLQDLDLSVEGVAVERFAADLQARLGGKLSCHLEFGTCTLALENGLVIDIATTRDEYYPHPAALPEVVPGTLQRDLLRRDFSVNAAAIRLSPAPQLLIDPYGGLADLQARRLRALHPLSFVEDPTRIVRGARLAGRLGLNFDETTLAQLGAALEPEVITRLSASRLRAELELTLAETRVAPALTLLETIGALEPLFGLRAESDLLGRLDELRRSGEVPSESYLFALLLGVPAAARAATLARFHWPKRYTEVLSRLEAVRAAGDASEAQLARADEAERVLLTAFGPALAARVLEYGASAKRQKVGGQDVLDLGLSPGPEVGEVLRAVAEARHTKRVTTYEEELELAKTLVRSQLDAQE